MIKLKNVRKSINELSGVAMALGGLVITVLVIYLVTGVTQQTALSGAVTVPADVNTSMSASAQQMTDQVDTVVDAGDTGVGLIPIAILILVFGFGGFLAGKKTSRKSGGAY